MRSATQEGSQHWRRLAARAGTRAALCTLRGATRTARRPARSCSWGVEAGARHRHVPGPLPAGAAAQTPAGPRLWWAGMGQRFAAGVLRSGLQLPVPLCLSPQLHGGSQPGSTHHRAPRLQRWWGWPWRQAWRRPAWWRRSPSTPTSTCFSASACTSRCERPVFTLRLHCFGTPPCTHAPAGPPATHPCPGCCGLPGRRGAARSARHGLL